MGTIIYLSYFLNPSTPAYGGGTSFYQEKMKQIDKGDSCNSLLFRLPNHLGTHIDCPKHFVHNGKTVSGYPPDFWIFNKSHLIVIPSVVPEAIIGPHDLSLDGIPKKTEMLIIKTGFGRFRGENIYWEKNPGFSPELADILRRELPHLRIFGFDAISISSFTHRDIGRATHKAFLDNLRPILILEDMNLSPVNEQVHFKKIVVAPLQVEEADAASCTVFAEIESSEITQP